MVYMSYASALLSWAAAAYKLPTLRRHPRDPDVCALWWSLVALALAQTLLLPPLHLGIGRLTGSLIWRDHWVTASAWPAAGRSSPTCCT